MAGFVTALVLLPTPGSKLEMKWQGPFAVMRALEDGLNYELDTGKTCKQPGEGVLPNMGYIVMCRCEGYGFQAVYSRKGYINQNIWV